MAVPVINSVLAIDAVLNVGIKYAIHATGHPTSFNASDLPTGMAVDTSNGRISGKIHAIGVYTVGLTATNTDGDGTADLVITVTDGGVPEGTETGITLFQAKYWADENELIDYADLDSAGQPIVEFDPSSIGTDALTADAVENKIDAIGGPGRVGQIVLDHDILFLGARLVLEIGNVIMPGVTNGDVVVVSEMLLADGTFPQIFNRLYFGRATSNVVHIYCFATVSGSTLPKGAKINFRVFGFPT